MLRLGLHVSISGTFDSAVDRAVERGCNTFQVFTKNPRVWRSKDLSSYEVEAFIEKANHYGINPVFGHVAYLLNIASPRDDIYKKTVESLVLELKRCEGLRIPYLVTHLGSHLGTGKLAGFERIINAIDTSLSQVSDGVMLLLENTAGTRNSMGGTFEDIRYIIDRVDKSEQVGVCFDTSHGYATGCDLRTALAVEVTLSKFDEIVGLEKMKLVHLNDSKGDLGSHVDRHEHIGMGRIGEKGFRNILKSKFGQLPLILETPIDSRRNDIENLQKVRELAEQA